MDASVYIPPFVDPVPPPPRRQQFCLFHNYIVICTFISIQNILCLKITRGAGGGGREQVRMTWVYSFQSQAHNANSPNHSRRMIE